MPEKLERERPRSELDRSAEQPSNRLRSSTPAEGLSKLPIEIVLMVMDGLKHFKDLNALSRSCFKIGSIASDRLYKRYATYALFWGAEHNKVEVVAKALQYRDINIYEPTGPGYTPLMSAATYGHVDVARWLLSNGANINATTTGVKDTALFLATRGGHKEMIRLLLEHGANVDDREGLSGGTVLHDAALQRTSDTAKILLDNGANVNASNNKGNTPLLLAIGCENYELMRLFLHHKANIELPNNHGLYPVHLAVEGDDILPLKILLDAGADVDVRDEAGRSALDMTDKPAARLLLNQAKDRRSRLGG